MPMSRVAARGAVAAIAAALMLGMMPTAQSVAPLPTDPDRRCAWPVVYPGEANYAWPDTNAAYINQAALIGKGIEALDKLSSCAPDNTDFKKQCDGVKAALGRYLNNAKSAGGAS